jgi:hypothetical protein
MEVFSLFFFKEKKRVGEGELDQIFMIPKF